MRVFMTEDVRAFQAVRQHEFFVIKQIDGWTVADDPAPAAVLSLPSPLAAADPPIAVLTLPVPCASAESPVAVLWPPSPLLLALCPVATLKL